MQRLKAEIEVQFARHLEEPFFWKQLAEESPTESLFSSATIRTIRMICALAAASRRWFFRIERSSQHTGCCLRRALALVDNPELSALLEQALSATA